MCLTEFIDQDGTISEFGYKLPTRLTDKCFARCFICGKSVKTTLRSIKRISKKSNMYRCSACISRSDEGRLVRSNQSKKLWNDKEKAESLRNKLVEISNSDEGKKQRSKQAKEAWQSEQFANEQLERVSKLFRSDEHKKLVSERNKHEFLEDPKKYIENRTSFLWTDKAKINHNVSVQDENYKKLHSKLAIERFKNPEYKAKIAESFQGLPRGGKMSGPEVIILDILKNLGLDFVYNKNVGPYNFDFYISDFDLYIEVQGEYWHTLPNNERRDRSKYTYLRNSYPESKIIYIWDFDIVSGIYETKLKQAMDLENMPNIDFNLSDLKISFVDWKLAKQFLSSWHYAQFGKHGKMIVGASLDDKLIAVAKFGPVSRKEIATSIGSTSDKTYELDRFCIHPMRQKKNFGSYFLSRSTKMFFKKFNKCENIIAFSDTTFGHSGTLYKASNWTEVGKVKPDYVYVRSDGWMMHKKTLYNQACSVHMSESEYALKNGWKKVFGKEKIKFMLSR